MMSGTTCAKRVLIVDDSSTMRAMLHGVMSDSPDFEVVGLAKTAQEAFDLVESTVLHIVMIDLCMPAIDGAGLLEMLEGYPALVKVVLSTEKNAGKPARERLFSLGASAFFDKLAVSADPETFRRKLLDVARKDRNGGKPPARVEPEPGPANVIFAAERFPVPRDEAARVAKLAQMQVANLNSDPGLDIIVQHLSRSTGYPMVFISLIDVDTLWMKAAAGIERQALPRGETICAHGLCVDGPLSVADTITHPVFSQLPMIAGDPHVRAYAGAPIMSKDEVKLGMLCVADTRPRGTSLAVETILTDAAALVGAFLEEAGQDKRRAA